MTVFKKNSLVLNVSIDGQLLFALESDNENNNRTTTFDLTQGVLLYDLSTTEVIIEQQDFPPDGEPFTIEIHNRWPHISYDGGRDLVFAGGIGVGMGTIDMIDNPSLENTYGTGTSIETYFNYLSKHQLSIKAISGKLIKFKSSI